MRALYLLALGRRLPPAGLRCLPGRQRWAQHLIWACELHGRPVLPQVHPEGGLWLDCVEQLPRPDLWQSRPCAG
uniref:Uncharacterized protein n=1 Tax=Kryptoperidinium triquetrum TaxID=66468 RepID=Q5ENJ9_KRYTR|nr:unknown protein [Heterocapsa triquetra]